MKRIFLLFLLSIGIAGISNAQLDNSATLIFKRPWSGAGAPWGASDYYESKIFINGVEACILETNSEKIVSCTLKVAPGEVTIKLTSSRGSDYNYVIDINKNKIYTLIVYVRNIQTDDLIWTTMSKPLIKNKVVESDEYGKMSFKTQVISID